MLLVANKHYLFETRNCFFRAVWACSHCEMSGSVWLKNQEEIQCTVVSHFKNRRLVKIGSESGDQPKTSQTERSKKLTDCQTEPVSGQI